MPKKEILDFKLAPCLEQVGDKPSHGAWQTSWRMMSRVSLNARIRLDGIFGNDKSRKVARPTGRTDICLKSSDYGLWRTCSASSRTFLSPRKIRLLLRKASCMPI